MTSPARPDAATWAKFIDSCHCQFQSEPPTPCDGWLQHRKCDALSNALATLHAQAVAVTFREGELSEAAKHADCCVDREAMAQAVAAVEQERDVLKHTLELWDRECGGQSPRELVAQAVREERGACIAAINLLRSTGQRTGRADIWDSAIHHATAALRARGPQ